MLGSRDVGRRGTKAITPRGATQTMKEKTALYIRFRPRGYAKLGWGREFNWPRSKAVCFQQVKTIKGRPLRSKQQATGEEGAIYRGDDEKEGSVEGKLINFLGTGLETGRGQPF